MPLFTDETGEATLEQILGVWPGRDYDEPLPSLVGFAKIDDRWALQELVDWIEPQTTCAYIMRHHGADGLKRVLSGLAVSCSRNNVHMRERVASMAAALDLEII